MQVVKRTPGPAGDVSLDLSESSEFLGESRVGGRARTSNSAPTKVLEYVVVAHYRPVVNLRAPNLEGSRY